MNEKFTMKKKWHILNKEGIAIGVAAMSFTPVIVFNLHMFMLAWYDVEQKHTLAELFDEEGNGLSPNHYRLENTSDEPAN